MALRHSVTACIISLFLATVRADWLDSLATQLKGLLGEQQLQEQIDQLARFNAAEAPAVTRVLFSPEDMQARAHIMHLMRAANLTVRHDAMGNIYGRMDGTDPAAGVVATGSHTDAIPGSGAFDGTYGVLAGILALKALQAAGFRPQMGVEVVMFTSEEPTRFGMSCLGSRAMARRLPGSFLTDVRDADGVAFLEAASGAGYAADMRAEEVLQSAADTARDIRSFVELHIEQGPELEAAGSDIGVVNAIAAPAAMRVKFIGSGGHAGALLMHLRNDASLAAAELALKAEALARSRSRDTVATVGRWLVHPNAVNSVPSAVELEIDVRGVDPAERDAVVSGVESAAREIAEARKVELEYAVISHDPPAKCSSAVQDAIRGGASLVGASEMTLPSRAYHDALFMATMADTGMIFIPCRGGVSHRPEEFAAPRHMALGAQVLALTIAKLATAPPQASFDEL